MMERFSFKTKEGCSRLLALFIILILLSSFLGQLSQTDGGAIKIESIVLDAQGAELNGELYYPAGTTSNDKLPAVIVNHGGGYTSVYAHCLSLAVHAGQSVKQGQLIGYVGSTGRSSGNHCHFEIRLNGSYVPPQNVFPGKR